MIPTSEAGLVRAIGTRQLTASIVNTTIGAGIFVLPAIVASTLGAAAPLAYIVCGLLMALIVCCFASAGSRVSLTGGLYAYVEVAFGPFVGFLAGALYFLMATFAVASVASAFAGSVGALWPPAASVVGRAIVILALFASLATINVRGVTAGIRTVELATALKLVPLALFVGVGIWSMNPAYLRWTALPDLSSIGQTSIVLIFAFAGVEVALVPSGEVTDPAKTVPRALFSALALTTTLYVLIQAVALGTIGPTLAQHGAAPLADAAERVLGRIGRLLILGGAVVSMFGYASGDMLGTPRVLFAFARDGILPEPFARIHPRFRTPYVAICIYACGVALLAVSSSFTQLAILANVAALTLYLLCVIASFALQRRDVRTDSALPPFSLVGGPVIPILAAAVILWLLSHATRREFGIEALALAVATLFYVIRRTGGRL